MTADKAGNGGPGWESFWAAAPAADASFESPAVRERLSAWWREEFNAIPGGGPLSGADLCCGAGVVSKWAVDFLNERGHAFEKLYCVDASASAARAAANLSNGEALIADLAALPLEDGSIDLAFSQFGVEYAGEKGFLEVARIMAPGGAFIAVVHKADGGLARECRNNLALFNDLVATEIFENAEGFFQQSYGAAHARAVKGSLAACEKIISRQSETIAMNFARQTLGDLVVMLNRRRAYAEKDVIGWIGNVRGELTRSRRRYEAMLSAAQSEDDIRKTISAWRDAGIEPREPQTILMPSGAELAWGLAASRA
ncbi:MAG: methyltransferase domain-containing protein [Parvularculaceae bacterium]